MQKRIHKFNLAVYRTFAFIGMYTILAIVLGYGFTFGFYSLSKTWIVPIRITPSNDKILAMRASVVTMAATLNTLSSNTEILIKQRVELTQQRVALLTLSQQLSSALSAEQGNNIASDTALQDLLKQKQDDISHTQSMLAEYEKMKTAIDHDLKLGLISQADAVQQETTLAQFKNSFTDSKVSQVMTELTRQKLMNTSVASVDVVSKQVALHTQIAQIDLQISQGDTSIKTNNMQVVEIQRALDISKSSPYYLASSGTRALSFAFVPYDNDSTVKQDVKVYDCYLSMVGCREVGSVQQVFGDEEKATNPFYKTDIRGFLIQLNLNRPESVKSKTLFIGRKPLLF